jgi:hypothetical protein
VRESGGFQDDMQREWRDSDDGDDSARRRRQKKEEKKKKKKKQQQEKEERRRLRNMEVDIYGAEDVGETSLPSVGGGSLSPSQGRQSPAEIDTMKWGDEFADDPEKLEKERRREEKRKKKAKRDKKERKKLEQAEAALEEMEANEATLRVQEEVRQRKIDTESSTAVDNQQKHDAATKLQAIARRNGAKVAVSSKREALAKVSSAGKILVRCDHDLICILFFVAGAWRSGRMSRHDPGA